MFKILDCTLRDGGYYTEWDFSKKLVDLYIKDFNNLPVDYIEVGYRSINLKGYYGKYFYNPIYVLSELRKSSNKKIVIILNEKDVRVNHVDELLSPCVGLVDMVRIALDPENLGRALGLAAEIKKLGFEVGFNVMYMSKWKQYSNFVSDLKELDGLADYFYMVDSYGGVYPEDVRNTIDLVRTNTSCKLGFHGHNNLELALINSLTAVEAGVEMIDSTILGMGRGAGNLKTELLLTVLNSKYNFDIDFNALASVVDAFAVLLDKYQWGTNLPYMISGSNSLPQKDVMDWMSTRFYSFNSITRTLQNKRNNVIDNDKFGEFAPGKSYDKVLILGGGQNAVEHSKAIIEFLESSGDICLIHASSKNASYYKDLTVDQYFCLVGSEGHRLEQVFEDLGDFNGNCVLPPYPRKMGTYVPLLIRGRCYQLKQFEFMDKKVDSHSALALQASIDLKAKQVFVAGFDGYQDSLIGQIERNLIEENEFFFDAYKKYTGLELISLTPSRYKSLTLNSVYSFIY